MSSDSAISTAHVLPWHETQWQALRARIDVNQVPHALLLNGAPGIGKLQFALATRNYLLCEQPDEFACGRCRSCKFLVAQTHADYFALQPEETGKAIRVDQVRELDQFVTQTAQRGARKVVLVHPADALNLNAANALLKNLEEPGMDTYFLLVCDSAGRLPPTIRSRCQNLTLETPTPPASLAWLTAQLGNAGNARLRLYQMHGRPCAALNADAERLRAQQAIAEGLLAVTQAQRALPAIIKQWSAWPLPIVLESLLNQLADLIRLSVAGEQDTLHTDEHRANAAGFETIAADRLFATYDRAQELLKKLHHGANPNAQLALESLLIEYCTGV